MDTLVIIIMTTLNLLTTAGLVVALITNSRQESRKKTELLIASRRSTEEDISKSLTESTHQLEFIDYTILSLVSIKISNNRILNTKVDMKNIDKDVKNLSMDVMHAIDKRFFESETSFYSKEFLMEYIIAKSKTTLIDAYRQSRMD